jgi:hypothetical protein
MKVYAEKLVQTVINKICDVCEQSVMIDEAKDLSNEKFGLVSDSFMIEQEEIIEKEKESAKSILSDVKINENVSDDESLQDSIDVTWSTKFRYPS